MFSWLAVGPASLTTCRSAPLRWWVRTWVRPSPKRRHDHRRKQHPRWTVEQVTPGTSRWTAPSGRTTEIIRRILPFLDDPDVIHLPAQCLTAETAALLEREADRLQQRIDCLTRNRDAIRAYLAAITGTAAPPTR